MRQLLIITPVKDSIDSTVGTMEAVVWNDITKKYNDIEKEEHPLVKRENTLKKLLEKGNYSNKYIKKAVMQNTGYKNLPSYSPGFDDL